MIYITKGREPAELVKYKKNGCSDTDFGFDGVNMPKAVVRTQLLKEQGYLCAYCMRRLIDDHTKVKIEHYEPRNSVNELDYNNLLAVCNGDVELQQKTLTKVRRVSCVPMTCDSAKDNTKISISPLDKVAMEWILYNDGRISIDKSCPQYDDYTKDLDVLNLNYELTALYSREKIPGNLIRARAALYRELKNSFKKACTKGTKKAVRDYMKKIERLSKNKNANGEYIEFVGVYQYFVKKHQKYLA